MKPFKLRNWQKHVLLFFLLTVTVTYLQFDLLKPALEIGFTPDDWSLYFGQRLLGENPVSKLAQVWNERGAYTTYQVYYISLLEAIVGFNYRSLQTINIVFRILAIFSLYPLILVVFKRGMLAFLASFLFAISFSSVGPLEFVVKGSDYLAIFFMNIFLIIYYLILTEKLKNKIWLAVSLVLLILTLAFSTIRLYPLLLIIPLIEIYLMIRNRNLEDIRKSFTRLLLFYSPFIALMIYSPGSILGNLQSPFDILDKITQGNWHLLLYSFSGMGSTFIVKEYWAKIFGTLSVDSLKDYLFFILGGPIVIYGLLTVIVAILRSKKSWYFFLFVISLNSTLEIIIFFIATHYRNLPAVSKMPYEPTGLYSVLFGVYILVLGFTLFLEYLRNKTGNILLKALWIGPAFLFIFTFATWVFAPLGSGFAGYYLVVATIGANIFTAALLVSIYDFGEHIKFRLLRFFPSMLVFLFISAIFLMNQKEIAVFFNYLNSNGRSASGQIMIQSKFREKVKDLDLSKPSLFYFDTSDIPDEGRFYTESFLSGFPFWMHFEGNQLVDRCLEVLYYNEHKQLLQHIKEENGQKGFFYRSLCIENGKGFYKELLYKRENFFAFKLKNRDFIDIKEAVLKELGLIQSF